MRYHEMLTETQFPDGAMKAWYHPATSQAIVFPASEMHSAVIRNDKAMFSVPEAEDSTFMLVNLAIEAGWARVRNFNEGKVYSMPRSHATDGLVQAMTALQVRKTLSWMERQGHLPQSVTIQIGLGRDTIDLTGEQIARYMTRGLLPR